MNFPRLVYRSASEHCLVEYESIYDLMLSDGWFATVPEALAAKTKKVEADNIPPTRAELETKATELSLKFDGRTPSEKLSRIIAEALVK